MDELNLTIDGEHVTVPAGTTILDAIYATGKSVPAVCYHEATTPNAICRTCVVEVKHSRVLIPSCIAEVAEGMSIMTRSERVELSRRTIFEMLNASVDLSETPEVLRMMDEYNCDRARFPDATRREYTIMDDNPMYLRDYNKCILCWCCVQVCAEDSQYTYAINFSNRGYTSQISTFFDITLPESTCVFCGQCVGVCPSGALKPKREWLLEQGFSFAEINASTSIKRKRKRDK